MGSFISACMWIVRTATQQQKVITGRFIQYLEKLVEQQQAENRLNRSAVLRLIGAVRRNTKRLDKIEKG